MKRKGNQNIITTGDIDVSSDLSALGENLDDVLSSQQTRIRKLESGQKWLYRYGGSGTGSSSGSGSGSTTTTEWSIYAAFTKDNTTYVLDGTSKEPRSTGTVSVNIHINKANGDTYAYTYTDGTTQKQGRLTVDNGYDVVLSGIKLTKNGTMTVRVSNGDGDIKSVSSEYIVVPYTLEDIVFIDNNSETIANSNGYYYLNNITNGFNASITYKLSTLVKSIRCTYETNYNNIEDFEIEATENTSGRLVFPMIETSTTKYSTGSSVTCHITIQYNDGSEETIDKTENFVLIPSTLFAIVSSDSGTLYENATESPSYITSGIVTLKVTDYYGSPVATPRNITTSIVVTDIAKGTVVYQDNKEMQEQIAYDYKPSLDEGSYHIVVTLTYSGESAVFEKYLYVRQPSTTADWYHKKTSTKYTYVGNNSQWYRGSNDNSNVLTGITSGYLTQTSQSDDVSLNFSNSIGALSDIVINIGLQYYKVNSNEFINDAPIFKLTGDGNFQLAVYQDKFSYAGSSADIYIPKSDNFKYTPEDFHLITIHKRALYANANSTTYSDVTLYIDGIYEGVIENFMPGFNTVNNLTFCSGNYFVNLWEVAEVTPYKFHEQDVALYLYKYQSSKMGATGLESKIAQLELFFDNSDGVAQIETSEHALNKVTSALVNSLALKASGSSVDTSVKDVPILVFTDTTNDDLDYPTFVSYTTHYYGQDATSMPQKRRGSLQYYVDGALQSPVDATAGYEFTLEVQGSSTMSYFGKNYTLGIQQNSTSSSEDTTYFFTPNYDSKDTSTFLPEKEFLLKKDISDSSHSNNTAMGSFINAATTKFNTQYSDSSKYPYGTHVKNCLTGFPVLLFVCDTDGQYYYLGIFNMNLGRSSYFNLGYSDASNFSLTGGFQIIEASYDYQELSSQVIVAEVQNNSKWNDYSQWNSTILFDYNPMFGDLVATNESAARTHISNLVERVAKAGDYMFNEIGTKTRVNLDDLDGSSMGAFFKPNQISNIYRQFIASSSGGVISYTANSTSPSTTTAATVGDLLGTADDAANGKSPLLDYQSVSEYYTICQAFGLVDSVQKNQNIKSFNGGSTFYAAFYDMDTSFGVDNEGSTDVSSFIFSDYWYQPHITVNGVEKTYQVITFNDFWPDSATVQATTKDNYPLYADTENIYYKKDDGYYYKLDTDEQKNVATVSNVYFDYNKGFDIPVTYLLAVAKYALLRDNSSGNQYFAWDAGTSESPQQIWAKWRKDSTSLCGSAKKVMEDHFTNHLSNVPEVLFSYNYRYSYMNFGATGYTGKSANTWEDLVVSKNTSYDDTNCKMFHGRNIYRATDWLDRRFHSLDFYFNIAKRNVGVGSKLYEPINDVTISNNDIWALSTAVDANRAYSTPVNIKTLSQSFLQLQGQNASTLLASYVFQDSTKTYQFTPPSNTQSNFYGSQAWTYVSSFNFITNSAAGSLVINSDYLTSVTANMGTCTAWSLTIPTLQTVSLNSGSFNGTLSLNSNSGVQMPNLKSIDISGSKISLSADSLEVQTINVSNISSQSLSIVNCSKLSSVNMSNTTITGTCTLSNTWTSTFNLKNTNINSLIITNYVSGASFTLDNDKSITSLTLTGFNIISVSNCPKLKTVYLYDNAVNSITSVSITSCNDSLVIDNASLLSNDEFTWSKSDATLFSVCTVSGSNNKGVVDLSGLSSLSDINFYETKGIFQCNLPARSVRLSAGAFHGTYLHYLDTSGTALLNGAYIFEQCQFYQMKQSNGSYTPLGVASGCTDLSRTFNAHTWDYNGMKRSYAHSAVSGLEPYARLTVADVNHFMNIIKDNTKIKTLAGMFQGRGISFTTSEYLNGASKISLTGCSAVTSVRGMFADNKIDLWYPELVGEGFGSSKGVDYDGFLITYYNSSNTPVGYGNGNSWGGYKLYYKSDHTLTAYKNCTNATVMGNNFATSSYYYNLYILPINESGSQYSGTLKMSVLFSGMTKLTTFESYDFTPSLSGITFDFEDFTTPFKDTLTSLNSLSFYQSMPVCTNTEGLFYNCKNLSSLSPGLNLYSTTRINISKFFDWNTLVTKCTSFMDVGSADWSGVGLQMNKTCTFSEMLAILNALVGTSSKIQTASVIFSYCTITDNTGADIVLSNTSSILYGINRLFYNCSASGSSTYLNINSLFKSMPNISQMSKAFYGCHIHQLPVNLFNKRSESSATVYNANNKSTTDTLHVFTYRQQISSMWMTFYSCTFEINYFNPQTDSSVKNNYLTSGNSSYYATSTATELTSVETTTEYSDLQYVKNTAYVTDGGSSYNPTSNALSCNGLVVPPDFFYGCTSSCTLQSVLGASNLTGMIPNHMLKNCQFGELYDSLGALNILPTLRAIDTSTSGVTKYYYSFVPSGYTSMSSLSYAFNFMVRLPSTYSNSATTQYFYSVLLEDSLVNNPTIMQNAWPKACGACALYSNPSQNQYAWSSKAIGGRYTLMAKLTAGSNTNTWSYSEGFSRYSNLNMDNFINPECLMAVYGSLFDSSFVFNSSTKRSSTNNIIIQSPGVASDGFISGNVMFPSMTYALTNFYSSSNQVVLANGTSQVPTDSKSYYIAVGLVAKS